jgi:hypothetical protein
MGRLKKWWWRGTGCWEAVAGAAEEVVVEGHWVLGSCCWGGCAKGDQVGESIERLVGGPMYSVATSPHATAHTRACIGACCVWNAPLPTIAHLSTKDGTRL